MAGGALGALGRWAACAPLLGLGAAAAWGAGPPAPPVVQAPRHVRQGEAFLVRVRSGIPRARLAARFGGRAVPLWPAAGSGPIFEGVAGVDLEEEGGPLLLVVEARGAQGAPARARHTVTVGKAFFPVQRLTVPRPFVELDGPTLERVRRERERMDSVLAGRSPRRLWSGPFRLPLGDAPPARGFGARRVVNGEPRAPHTGADFPVPAGTPVLAAQAGRVVLAEEHFFPGMAVVIDHGLGLFTMYFHLGAVQVRAGDPVQAGQPVGAVGASGRATGPHLHWGARLGGARIDPTALVRLDLR